MINFDSISKDNIPENHPILVFDAFWWATTKDNKSVRWCNFSPMEMTYVLPWILVLDCLPNDEYVYRVCGTGCDRIFNRNLTGSKFGEHVDKDWAKSRQAELAAIKSGGGPSYSKGNIPVTGRDHVKIFRGLYGFAYGGNKIDRLVAVVAPPNQPNIAL